MVRVPQVDRDAPGGEFLPAFGALGNATGQLKRPVLGRFLLILRWLFRVGAEDTVPPKSGLP